jgi:hypothetical protein
MMNNPLGWMLDGLPVPGGGNWDDVINDLKKDPTKKTASKSAHQELDELINGMVTEAIARGEHKLPGKPFDFNSPSPSTSACPGGR